MKVTLYSKLECGLCEELKEVLAHLQKEIEFEVKEQNIEHDPVNYERFRYLIPVLDIEGGQFLYPPHDFSQRTIRTFECPAGWGIAQIC